MPGEDGLIDTMCDLIVDTVGAIIACIGGYIYIKRKKDEYIKKLHNTEK